MAAPVWAFYPHPGGTKRRGLQLSEFGWLDWAACNVGDVRTESIWLPGPADAVLSSRDPEIATVAYGTNKVGGFTNLKVTAKAVGRTYLHARRGADAAIVFVDVFPELQVKVRFKAVDSTDWKSNLTAGKVQRLVEAANYIYSYQGNVKFTLVGGVQRVSLPGLPATVPTADMVNHSAVRDCGADVTVYFVRNTSALAANWRDLIIMEDVQSPPWDEMTLAHELGHRMGLRHPSPPIQWNLMNQTAVGDRHRYKIYLTRDQIRTVTDRTKWKTVPSDDPNVCPAG